MEQKKCKKRSASAAHTWCSLFYNRYFHRERNTTFHLPTAVDMRNTGDMLRAIASLPPAIKIDPVRGRHTIDKKKEKDTENETCKSEIVLWSLCHISHGHERHSLLCIYMVIDRLTDRSISPTEECPKWGSAYLYESPTCSTIIWSNCRCFGRWVWTARTARFRFHLYTVWIGVR